MPRYAGRVSHFSLWTEETVLRVPFGHGQLLGEENL